MSCPDTVLQARKALENGNHVESGCEMGSAVYRLEMGGRIHRPRKGGVLPSNQHFADKTEVTQDSAGFERKDHGYHLFSSHRDRGSFPGALQVSLSSTCRRKRSEKSAIGVYGVAPHLVVEETQMPFRAVEYST